MPTTEIPAAFKHVCDGCEAVQQSQSRTRPAYWCDLTVAQDAYDYQGHAVADGTIRKLLCDECKRAVVHAVNLNRQARRTPCRLHVRQTASDYARNRDRPMTLSHEQEEPRLVGGLPEGMLEYRIRTDIRDLASIYGFEQARNLVAGMLNDEASGRRPCRKS